MQLKRNYSNKGKARILKLPTTGVSAEFIKGHGREIMRHGSNTIHAAIIERTANGINRLSLFAMENGMGKWKKYINQVGGRILIL